MPKTSGKQTKSAYGKKKRATKMVTADEVKTIVKSQLSRALEDKIANPVRDSNLNIILNNIGTGATSTVIDISQVLEVIQGVAQGERVGNRIRPKNITFRGHIEALNSIAQPVCVKMIILRRRDAIVPLTNMSNFLQYGNTSQAPSGVPADLYAPINLDKYKVVKTRLFTLGGENALTGGNYVNYAAANGVRAMYRFSMNLTKYFPKVIKYNDNTVIPTNAGLYVYFIGSYLSGSSVFPNATPIADISYVTSLTFEDA